jgi:hypothetical protein
VSAIAPDHFFTVAKISIFWTSIKPTLCFHSG